MLAGSVLAQPPLEAVQSALGRQDYKGAVKLLQPLVEEGNADAQTVLAMLYENGLGVEQDLAKAVELYGKAAEQGQAGAQLNLADMLVIGRGADQNLDKAIGWYRKAAEAGGADAFFRLGMMLQEGTIVGMLFGPHKQGATFIIDRSREAIEWYSKAAELGHVSARHRLNGIIPSDFPAARDAVCYVEAKMLHNVVAPVERSGRPAIFLPTTAGCAQRSAWGPRSSMDVDAVASELLAEVRKRLETVGHETLPATMSLEASGDCVDSVKALTGLKQDGAELTVTASDKTTSAKWAGAIVQNHIVLGSYVIEYDAYFTINSAFTNALIGDWVDGSATLWDPPHLCQLDVTAE